MNYCFLDSHRRYVGAGFIPARSSNLNSSSDRAGINPAPTKEIAPDLLRRYVHSL
jgi:hypothetical protein